MKMWRATILLFTCIVSACSYGITAKKFPPAQGPSGVMMTITTDQLTLHGELIEVRDSGLVIVSQSENKLWFVPYAATIRSTIAQTANRYAIKNHQPPGPEVREHLRLISRFPQGLTPELLQQLLSLHQQTQLAGSLP